MSFSSLLAQYDYAFPTELIATFPANPRESARLMVYNRTKNVINFDTFTNITDYLPQNAVLVFNRTKVIPAKFELTKATGGKVSALFLGNAMEHIRVLASGSFKEGDMLNWEEGHQFSVIARHEKEATLKPLFDLSLMASLLERFGTTPLPPYMKDSPLNEEDRRREYQTVFAEEKGSVAAPTAGLHFSENLIKKIVQFGCSIEYVTLHVNLGTFAPLTEDQWEKKQLHTEYYSIDSDVADRLNAAKEQGRPIIAVGTTSVRTLESACLNKKIVHLNGETNLFLTEDSILQFVDHLITNFHVPKSSLLMLVSALTGREKLLELYNIAITERFRLFSFGDGMMIL